MTTIAGLCSCGIINVKEGMGKVVSVMKGMKLPVKHQPKTVMPMMDKHEQMIRRAANHNLHVITHHGKIMVGRKGRTT
jgi:hypothetical protein